MACVNEFRGQALGIAKLESRGVKGNLKIMKIGQKLFLVLEKALLWMVHWKDFRHPPMLCPKQQNGNG